MPPVNQCSPSAKTKPSHENTKGAARAITWIGDNQTTTGQHMPLALRCWEYLDGKSFIQSSAGRAPTFSFLPFPSPWALRLVCLCFRADDVCSESRRGLAMDMSAKTFSSCLSG